MSTIQIAIIVAIGLPLLAIATLVIRRIQLKRRQHQLMLLQNKALSLFDQSDRNSLTIEQLSIKLGIPTADAVAVIRALRKKGHRVQNTNSAFDPVYTLKGPR